MTVHNQKVMIIFSCILLSLLLCPNSLATLVDLLGIVSVITTLAVIVALVKKEYRCVVYRCNVVEKYFLTTVALFSVWYVLACPSYR